MPVLLLHYSLNLLQMGVTYTSISYTRPDLVAAYLTSCLAERERTEFSTLSGQDGVIECPSERQLEKEHHDLSSKSLATLIVPILS